MESVWFISRSFGFDRWHTVKAHSGFEALKASHPKADYLGPFELQSEADRAADRMFGIVASSFNPEAKA